MVRRMINCLQARKANGLGCGGQAGDNASDARPEQDVRWPSLDPSSVVQSHCRTAPRHEVMACGRSPFRVLIPSLQSVVLSNSSIPNTSYAVGSGSPDAGG